MLGGVIVRSQSREHLAV